MYTENVVVRITYIKGDSTRVIYEYPEAAVAIVNYQEVLGCIEGYLVLVMLRIIGIVAYIDPASLVYASYGLAESEHHVPFPEHIGKRLRLRVI